MSIAKAEWAAIIDAAARQMIEDFTPTDEDAQDCPRCGDAPSISISHLDDGWLIGCDNCYDGAPDSSTRSEYAIGGTVEAAAREWNTMIDDGFIGEN